MADAGKAVFLSYAREDIAAARRIADALRAFGVEVWFDQEELRGGDAWDAKIRGQIRACALFVPLVSQHTQERSEGYFRREWRLAVDRTLDMVAGAAFIVPVVIDDTAENSSAVPEEFLRYQWTRLPHGVPTLQFVEQVKRLLAPASPLEVGRPRPARRDEGVASPAKPPLRARVLAAVAVLAIALTATFFATRKSPSAAAQPPMDFAAAKSTAKSIAVLPFANMSDDKDSGFFADGVHEDILTSLYLIPDLKVTSRTSVAQYRDTKKTMRQIGQELGVTYILEGSVRRDGKTVRVTSQLIRAASDEHLWARRYDKELRDLFAIQSELAQAIADELQAKLSPQAKKLLDRRPTENPAAYDLFLKARDIRNSLGQSDRAAVEKRENLLQAAVVLDPNFALAWADLTWVHGWTYLSNWEHTAARLARAKGAIDTALRLAPDAPEVILNLGYYHYFGHRGYARASEQFEKSARLQPNAPAPRFALALIHRRQGSWVEALEGFRTLAQLDPTNFQYSNQIVLAATAGRRWDLAREERRRWHGLAPDPRAEATTLAQFTFWARGSTREIEAVLAGLSAGETSSPYGLDVRMTLALMRGDHAEVVRVDRLQSLVAGDVMTELAQVLPMATALAAHGDLAGARTRLEKFPSKLRARLELEPENANLWSRLGAVEAMLGHKEEALRCARKAVKLVPESVDASDGAAYGSYVAFVHTWTGDKENALAEYTRLLGIPVYTGGVVNVYGGAVNVHVMKHHPYFFPLQGDPRFEALLNDPKNNQPLF
ncbi:MAG: TIR domain-containing protein [Verrucomicrobia bacterium]|nr:TIR domain-containing protein [Verrucomicrobiota bacterium]